MTQADILKQLKSLGWQQRRMNGGGYLYYVLADRTLRVAPMLRQLPDGYSLDFQQALTTGEFNAAVSLALGEKPGFDYFLLNPRIGLRAKKVNFTEADIVAYHGQLLSWAQSADLVAAFRDHMDWPSNAAPLLAIYKLIALVNHGRRAEVEDLLQRFRRGDRCGYVPIISEALIERVLAMPPLRLS
ncbi:MAG: hypothetical protein U1E48_00275 [Paracoccaceae bacterium]